MFGAAGVERWHTSLYRGTLEAKYYFIIKNDSRDAVKSNDSIAIAKH